MKQGGSVREWYTIFRLLYVVCTHLENELRILFFFGNLASYIHGTLNVRLRSCVARKVS